jgi:hypothetical protein
LARIALLSPTDEVPLPRRKKKRISPGIKIKDLLRESRKTAAEIMTPAVKTIIRDPRRKIHPRGMLNLLRRDEL